MATMTIALPNECLLELEEKATRLGVSPVDEQEKVILQVAAGSLEREAFTAWLRGHIVEKK